MKSEVRQWLEAHRKPAIWIVDGEASSRSWLGGNPCVPSGFSWPTFRGEPIPFLGQICFADLPVAEGLPVFPKSGHLAVFFAIEGGISSPNDPDPGFAVLYFDQESELSEVGYPGGLPALDPVTGWRKLLGFRPKRVERRFYNRRSITFKASVTYSASVPDDLLDTDDELEVETFMIDQLVKGLEHHLFGYADPVQSTPEEMIEDVSEPAPGEAREKWALLLQIDEDGETGFEWIDCGKVFFWIRETDLAEARFDRVKAIIDFS
ncbi:MAG TPA: YwqG family protein [Fimbriimonas sp.]|nr:YwqG family protein [Fimbriimonas sp.]